MGKLKIKKTPFTVPGFLFDGLHCGIKDQPRKKDLGVIYATEKETQIAGVFTQNKICAGPVRQCKANLKKAQGRLVVVNSGTANAATGKQGRLDAQDTAKQASQTFNLKTKDVFICSTGRIGERVPKKKIITGLEKMKPDAGKLWDFAEAICTTDQYCKVVTHKGKIAGKPFRIAIIAKGAGMICPNMATMLCYVVTDLNLSKMTAQKLLKESVDDSLNCLTVDGDTSTNDTTLLLASGLAKNKSLKTNSKNYEQIKAVLTKLLQQICEFITLDGEGATTCFRVHVSGAKNKKQAQVIAKAVGNSQLVKTAIFGCDPNWGRIICAAGYSGSDIVEEKTTVKIGSIPVFRKGKPLNANEKKASQYLKKNQLVDLHLEIGLGQGKAKVYSSDLTHGYVRFNAEYRT